MKLTEERLHELAKGDMDIWYSESQSMAKELLAQRKAFSEPFCFTDNAGIDLWHMSESFEVWPERDGDISIPLFRKPVID